MLFVKSNLKKVLACTLAALVCLCSLAEIQVSAADKKSGNVTSTKVDSNYFKTVKSNGSTWYVANNNPSLVYEGRNDVHITTSGKSVGTYSFEAGEFDYTYERLAVMDYNTGKTALIDEDYRKVSDFCDEYDIFIATTYRNQEYLPSGLKSTSLQTYAYFTYDGKRLTNIDYLYASPFYNGYALVEYYKNYELYHEIINTKGKSVAEVNIASVDNYAPRAYIRAFNSNNELCYVDVANGGTVLSKDELGDMVQLNNVAYEYQDKDALNTFLKKQASKWKEYRYLGKDLFYVKNADEKGSIVNAKGKVILSDDSDGKVSQPDGTYSFLCPTAFYIDGEIYLSKSRGSYEDDMIFAVYDSTGKKIIGFDRKYQLIKAADAGFLCGYNLNKLNRYLGQSVVDTKGNVIVDLPWKNGTLFTIYQGEFINPEHDYYDENSVPVGQTFVISDRYKGVTNTIKSTLLDKNVGKKASELAKTDWGDGTKGYAPLWNVIAGTYNSFLKKTGVPAFHAWNLYLTMKASPVVQRPNAGAGVINVNSKGKEIDYLSRLRKNSVSLSSVTSTEVNQADLEWNAVDGAAKYRVQYQKKGYDKYDAKNTISVTVKGKTGTSVVTEEGGKYRFRVIAVDASGHAVAPVSAWVEVTMAKAQVVTVLEDPMKYFTSIDNSAAGKITLKWNAVDGAYTYRIAVKRATTSGEGEIKKVENKTSYTVDAKYAGQDYVFRIMAWDSKGKVVLSWTDWTSPVTVKAEKKTDDGTSGQKTDNGSAKKTSFTSITSTASKKATLSWEPVEGAAGYRIASKRSTVSGNGTTTSSSGTSATLTLKYSDVKYVFRIKAVDANGNDITGWSEWSKPVYIMK